jgi:hypothetical protein
MIAWLGRRIARAFFRPLMDVDYTALEAHMDRTAKAWFK